MWTAPAPFTRQPRGLSGALSRGIARIQCVLKTCNPMDDHNHGTHVAGTIGAGGNASASSG